MKILVVLPEGFKNKRMEELCQDYLKRSSSYCSIKMEFLNLGKKGEEAKDEVLLACLKKLTPPYSLVVLDEQGKTFSSVDFSKFLEKNFNQSLHTLIFAIGGAHGYSEKMLKQAQLRLSLSPMTMAHELAGVVLTEQIYRGLSILNHHPYHKQ